MNNAQECAEQQVRAFFLLRKELFLRIIVFLPIFLRYLYLEVATIK